MRGGRSPGAGLGTPGLEGVLCHMDDTLVFGASLCGAAKTAKGRSDS